jgi:predicted house-cleaning NTP pyrophosphatase (Maf/HAM1 superfamily)
MNHNNDKPVRDNFLVFGQPKIEDDEIEEYIQSGAPFDKAGAYGIQDDLSALFVERIDGDFYNVVGLPLPRFYLALKRFGTTAK